MDLIDKLLTTSEISGWNFIQGETDQRLGMAALEVDRRGEVLIELDPAGQPFELAVA